MKSKEYNRREFLGIFTAAAIGFTVGGCIQLDDPPRHVKLPKTPTEIEKIVDKAHLFYKQAKRHALINGLPKEDDYAMSLCLGALYNPSENLALMLGYYEQIKNERVFEAFHEIPLVLSIEGFLGGYSSGLLLKGYDTIGRITNATPPIAAQLTNTSLGVVDLRSTVSMYVLAMNKNLVPTVVPTFEMVPILSSAALNENLDGTIELCQTINDNVTHDFNLSPIFTEITSLNDRDWMKVGSDYTDITMKEQELKEKAQLDLLLALTINHHDQKELWEVFKLAEGLTGDKDKAAQLALISCVKLHQAELGYKKALRFASVALEALLTWDFLKNPIPYRPNRKISLV